MLTHPLVAWGWAELLHEEEKTYENLKEVRAEVQRETNRVAGINKARSTSLLVCSCVCSCVCVRVRACT